MRGPEFFVYFIENLLAQAAKVHSYANYASALMIILALAGLALFIVWAIKNNFGRDTLQRARFRSNSMPFYVPFAVIFGWLFLSVMVAGLAKSLSAQMPDWQQQFIAFSLLILVEIIIVIYILAAAKKYFDGGLKGFGLRPEGLGDDIASAAAIFFAIWPLVMIVIYLTMFIGRIIEGPAFQMEQNEGLKAILENDQLVMRILMIFFATILTPVFEELVFRGLIQSYLRDIGFGPWRSIIGTSVVFTILHPLMHFPGLFILALAMGYAYEKSGSLWRSIFLHCIFNSTQIAFALLMS